MIALETSAKIGKSPKKPYIDTVIEDDVEESDDDIDDEDMESIDEVNDVESADEGVAEVQTDDNVEMDSRAEGDQSDTEEDARKKSHDETNKFKANPGWADAMQKILRTKKPKRKKTIVLSKAKKLCDVVPKKEEKRVEFEIEGEDGKVREETSKLSKKSNGEEGGKLSQIKQKRKEVDLGIRVKPSVLDRERERMLQKIATKGVVQLFNVVRQQQKEIDKKLVEAGPLERKREQVLKNVDKRAFLDVLMGGSKSIQVEDHVEDNNKQKNDGEEKDGEVWSVLRDDFVMGAKLKDWDKKAPEEEDDSSATEDMDSDD